MITNLRNAKARLSELVEQAAGGEEIVITVRGRAKAKLSGIREPDPGEFSGWGESLRKTRRAHRGKVVPQETQALWDELRGE
ncbi:MAG: type II toxin-antitoxin system prevent-host-death family antitoxin [Opitutales bacterium]|nr:type II toxin-antitoxin system prevent-host-death family antitoxin [Opitutales bacterium]